MIEGFEEETSPLTDEEREVILPVMLKGLRTKIGKKNAIKSDKVIEYFASQGYKMGGARFRKLINYIRTNNILPFLMASSSGYYIENDREAMLKYIDSLHQRANAINAVANAMQKQLDNTCKHENYVSSGGLGQCYDCGLEMY